MENEIIKLCKCGCGEPVTMRRDKTYNDFINHHHIRLNNPAKSDSFRERMTGENNPAKRPEVRDKISKNLKGVYVGEKNHMTQDKYKKMFSEMNSGENNGMYGKEHSKESKEKMSVSQKNRPPDSEETRIKKSKANKGIPKSEEHKRKLSESNIKNNVSVGENNPFYGKKHSEETREIISQKTIKRFENIENHPSWRGGLSFEPYTVEFNESLKRKIRIRDNNICQNSNCKKQIQNGDVHHINYIKKDCNENNLITLCKSCHTKTNTNREYWEEFYKNIIELKNRENQFDNPDL